MVSRCYDAVNFIRQSAAEAKYPGERHPRERASVEVPYEPPGEEPFQVQTQREQPSRGGVTGGTLQPPGLDRALKEKQIRWHHGAAAFVLK